MPANQETLLRQWHMLRCIPRYPHKSTVRALQEKLKGEGFNVSDRTLQRDLLELSEVFPLTVDDREKPFGWSWQKDAKAFDLPGLSVAEALTWVMAQQHLDKLLPGSLLDNLAPQFRAARERLDKEPQPQHGRNWLSKVRTVLPSQPLMSPEVDAEIQHVVSDAVLQERQLLIHYRGKGKSEVSEYQVHPLAIVQRGQIVYLYCRIRDYQNTRILAMHRIASARLLDEPAVAPEGFDLDDKIAKGVWSFGEDEQISLCCRFYDGKGEHLQETPLSADQQITLAADDPRQLTVRATVIDNPQLRWWLQGFGDGVEVLEPATLRREMSQVAGKLFQRYSPT